MEYDKIRELLQKSILEKIDYSKESDDGEILELIDEQTLSLGKANRLTYAQMKTLRQDVYHSIRKLDVLQELIEQPGITEIMINGTGSIFIEKDGKTSLYHQNFASREKLEDVIQQIVAGCNRVVNEASPIVDARLPDGARVNVVMPPIALNGPIVTIRRFPEKPIRMETLLGYGSLSREIADFLKKMVYSGYNIFVSGGTGSGKTTFLNAMSDFIPETERIITIEDNAELQIRHIPNLVQLEARNANVEGCVPITIRDLIKSSLRMRPDRIIVGEVRGAEAIDMISAMNTGHDGSMSTGHANSPVDMLSRLETMILMGMELPIDAVRRQLASGLDLIVHLGRLRDGSRKLLRVDEVLGMKNGEIELATLFRYEEKGEINGRVIGNWKQEAELYNREKLYQAGVEKKAVGTQPG